ncbi:Transcriptional regulator, MarR family [Alloactinosynnema sp. L-07]|uniref:MarR family winged helix-turn-helix transcriptional regulator n=1 Tax=Alloactinosynnema sp. L-07 TaxID=1653480 RepID=UPI00065EF502|nr:MarR family transcriptional regulator [Alloactinosynnema sp. L-07]CRK55086.1 Transcriptional regulator, MarR family [Alloactinosynnema sp. L-07]
MLVERILQTLRDNAGRSLLLHQKIADGFGLNSTDLMCLDLARHETDLTAGRLAAITGMSTSAITAVLDRLSKAGLVERRRDEHDRRKVFVESTGRHEVEVQRAYAPLADAFRELLESYSERDLEMLHEFTKRNGELVSELIAIIEAERVAAKSAERKPEAAGKTP